MLLLVVSCSFSISQFFFLLRSFRSQCHFFPSRGCVPNMRELKEELQLRHVDSWLWLKNRNSKMACPGKWKHGPNPLQFALLFKFEPHPCIWIGWCHKAPNFATSVTAAGASESERCHSVVGGICLAVGCWETFMLVVGCCLLVVVGCWEFDIFARCGVVVDIPTYLLKFVFLLPFRVQRPQPFQGWFWPRRRQLTL